MTDRRRINGPAGGTLPPVFAFPLTSSDSPLIKRPRRGRAPTELRKTFLKTGLTPSASGSAYLELSKEQKDGSYKSSLLPTASALKLACTVHGPRPLSRNAAFTPSILLSAHVKFAPFAARVRRGYLRDSSERDLATHLENALRGVIIGDRWPKSGLDIVVTILEGEEDQWWADHAWLGANTQEGDGSSSLMSILSGCITVASAAVVDAGIDCVDLVSGGVAAIVPQQSVDDREEEEESQIVLDPAWEEHGSVHTTCVVGYLQSRDEIVEVWIKGGIFPTSGYGLGNQDNSMTSLIDSAIQAAMSAQSALAEVIIESVEAKATNAMTKIGT